VRILDAYILRRTLAPLAVVLGAFIGIFILVDLFDHAHTFIDNSVPAGVVLAYYAHYTPLIVVLTTPVAMLLATLLSLGRFARSNELLAMKGAGRSLYRILAPIFLLAVLVSLANVALGETILPEATKRRVEIEQEHLKRRADQIVRTGITYVRPDGTILLARRFHARKQTLEEVTVEEYDGEDVRPRTRIDARTARWADGHWILEDGEVRHFLSDREELTRFDSMELPYADPTPDDLTSRRLEPEEMGYRALALYIARLRASGIDPGDLAVRLRLKIAFPFVTLIMTAIGAPLAARTRRGGFALAFTAALAISFFYYGVLQVGQVLGRQGILSPALAAWMPNIIFGALAAGILVKTPK
jgi:lipopolysaccharide export system permease protein